MKVTIAAIPEEGLRLTERGDPAGWALGTPDVTFAEPVEVSAFFQRYEEDLLVTVEAAGTMTTVCGRCLQPSRQPYREQFHLAIEIQGRLSVDVTDDIRQEIIVSYPMKPLCRDDCRGLCPTCGQNLNEGPCPCSAAGSKGLEV